MTTNADHLPDAGKKAPAECVWHQTDMGCVYETGCGHMFEINDGTPEENDMAFCCYCGESIRAEIYADDDCEDVFDD